MSVVELCLLCEVSCVCCVSRCVTRVILGFHRFLYFILE